ncbi:hypothetical protein AMS68_002118 [Peltaster fructicola]|uniref:Peptidase S8/S53 domain-containing protein n=1 Tax=Peltaster fructicola TaxID=286661 RepID=A0A6H0XPM3_9PEZI|nr:hypothetical protein AMS68_002118 [Peltaster fructicola]
MRSWSQVICLIALLSSTLASPWPRACNADYQTHPDIKDTNDYLVGFKDGSYTLAEHLRTINTTFEAEAYRGGYCASLTSDQLAKVRTDCNVQLVEDDIHGQPFGENEPQEDANLALGSRDKEDSAGWALKFLSALTKNPSDSSYYYLKDAGKNVDVYILDSGINHMTELDGSDGKTRVIDISKQKKDADYTDMADHGTIVAVCVGGAKKGVAKAANLLNLKVAYFYGQEWAPKAAYVLRAIDAVIQRHNKRKNDDDFKGSIINMSLDFTSRSAQVAKKLDEAHNAGITLVAAAGNFGYNPSIFPASHPKVISVGSITEHYEPFHDANNPASGSNFGSHVTLFAPGRQVPVINSAGAEKRETGTSFAAGYVSGILAIFYGVEGKSLTPDRARDLLMKQVDNYIVFDKFVDWQGSPNALANTGNRKGANRMPPVKYIDGPGVDPGSGTTNITIVSPPGSPLSCGGPVKFDREKAVSAINAFCSYQPYSGTIIVPAVSYGSNGVTKDNTKKSLGINNEQQSGDDQFFINVYFKEDSCQGMFTFNKDDCTKNLMTVVDGCNTDTTTAKLGGVVTDVCAQYRITAKANPSDPNPFKLQAIDSARLGDWKCEDMPNPINSRFLANTCQCYFTGQATVTDQFDKPSSGNCQDIKKGTSPRLLQ